MVSSPLLRNGVANVARGASGVLTSLLLPAILVRTLPSREFSAWTLVLQIAAYLAMLDLGLQVGIGRFIARETSRGDLRSRNGFFFGGALLLAGCGILALVATIFLAACLPSLVPKLDPDLVPKCRTAILLMGCGTAISLPFSAVAAMFVGVERYGIPAVVLGSGRIVQVVVTGLTAYATHDLTKIAVAYVGCLLTMQAAFLFILRKQYPDILGEREAVPRAAIQELLKYCFSLCVWNFSMFLVYGLDAGIVAEIDFKSLAPYALCLNLIALLTGFMGSAFNVLISRAAALEGAGEHEEVGRLLVSSTKISTSLLLAIGCLCPLLARPLFAAWVGPALRDAAMPFLWVLIVANGVRLLLTPYASLLMGAGDHKWASLTALAEGFSNLVASLLLGRIYGAIGVAYGTLVGALVSLTLAIFYTFPRATRIKCPRRAFLLDGFLTPAGKFIPLAIGMIVFERSPGPMTLTAVVIGLLATGFLLARVPSLRLGATHV